MRDDEMILGIIRRDWLEPDREPECPCCAGCGDGLYDGYEYDDEIYCRECLIDKLIEDGVVRVMEEE